jgi:hypothetical protein
LEKIVFEFFNRYYYVRTLTRVDWVFYKDSKESLDSEDLIDELTVIFSLNKEVIIFLFKEWVHKVYPSFDLTYYLNYGLSGTIYAPYMPVQQITVIEEDGFQPRLPISSRYARVEVNPNFYGVINPNSQIDFRP